jgi:hypothetical protein
MQVAENRRKLKMTILYRKDGVWHHDEVRKLSNGLTTEVSSHPKHPEYLVLFGHYTKEVTLQALGGGLAYTATEIVGIDNKQLPFPPGFI